MARIGRLLLAFMLFASLGFATISYAPSCATSYSVLNQTFIYTSYYGVIGCVASSEYAPLSYTVIPFASAEFISPLTTGQYFFGEYHNGAGYNDAGSRSTWAIPMSQFVTSQTLYIAAHTISGCTVWIGNSTAQTQFDTTAETDNYFNGTYDGNKWIFTNGSLTINISGSDYLNVSTTAVATTVRAYMTLNHANLTAPSRDLGTVGQLQNQSTFEYISITNFTSALTTGQSMIRSDFISGKINGVSSSTYCRSLLYFNNPYYGNIQLIPKVTYIPGTDAFGDFLNSSDNSAYIPNNTISYVYDSVTSAWYIVPATICTSYSIVGSTSTLQYNPTGIGASVGGTVPFDVNSITGSCSYNTGTRLITCTGTDSSNTITSLGLSAYKIGNSTDLCAQTVAGASGTLTCTLPAQNGTYNAYFYGTDANLLNHQFSYKQIQINSGTTGYGRDGYIVALLVFVVGSTLMSGSIAVSMVLGCFGLFLALAIGILPWSDAPVVIFFAAVALVISYRLKI